MLLAQANKAFYHDRCILKRVGAGAHRANGTYQRPLRTYRGHRADEGQHRSVDL